MIPAWRIARRPYADLSGEGARRWGGRWNRPGRPVIYLADHPALALLEVRVHLDLPFDLLPDDYVLMHVALPDGPLAEVTELPPDPQIAGATWLDQGEAVLLRVPSVLVPGAWNLLLNPTHPAGETARILARTPLRFDPRLWGTS
ncbi:MAG: RES family NAD+ phosphorylase [Acetobacteraceae bacterium]